MTAPAATDDRLRVVVDIRTGQTVFGPATAAQTSHWIIQDGFWMGADLRVLDVLPAESRLIGRLVTDLHDDSPCPPIGYIVGQIDEETVEVLWDGHATGPMREFLDALRPVPTGSDAR